MHGSMMCMCNDVHFRVYLLMEYCYVLLSIVTHFHEHHQLNAIYFRWRVVLPLQTMLVLLMTFNVYP